MSNESVEYLEEKLERIESTVEEIAQVLFKGNGHSLTSRIAILEKTIHDTHQDVETIRVGMHDLRTRVLLNENKIGQLEKGEDSGHSMISKVAILENRLSEAAEKLTEMRSNSNNLRLAIYAAVLGTAGNLLLFLLQMKR